MKNTAPDYAAALKVFLPLAEQGDAEAQYTVGMMYDFGSGVPQDDREAVRWYRLAADQGNAAAQFNLGGMYANGRGVPQNDREAARWLRLASDQGNADAQVDLGQMYDFGRGVPQDDREAARWYRLAAVRGHAGGQVNLGQTYYFGGKGIPQDYQEAMRWYRLAAEHVQGHEWQAIAQFSLGQMYDLGLGVPQDYREAARWYRLAADQGNAEAQLSLGSMYSKSRGVPRDSQVAAQWYRLAADQDNVTAQVNLGFMYSEGRGVPQDYKEAVRWWRLAADQGNAGILRSLSSEQIEFTEEEAEATLRAARRCAAIIGSDTASGIQVRSSNSRRIAKAVSAQGLTEHADDLVLRSASCRSIAEKNLLMAKAAIAMFKAYVLYDFPAYFYLCQIFGKIYELSGHPGCAVLEKECARQFLQSQSEFRPDEVDTILMNLTQYDIPGMVAMARDKA